MAAVPAGAAQTTGVSDGEGGAGQGRIWGAGAGSSKQHKHTPWGVACLGPPGEDTELACECMGRAEKLGTEHEPEAFHK